MEREGISTKVGVSAGDSKTGEGKAKIRRIAIYLLMTLLS
jgi:hypothetical protein